MALHLSTKNIVEALLLHTLVFCCHTHGLHFQAPLVLIQYMLVTGITNEQAPVGGHLSLLGPLVAAYENHSCKRPVPVTDTFSRPEGVLL